MSKIGFTGLKSRSRLDCVPSAGCRKGSVSLPFFLALSDHPHSLA